MSRHEYLYSLRILRYDPSFYSIIMAALYQANPKDRFKLQRAFPVIFEEFNKRFNNPLGLLPGECDMEKGYCLTEDGALLTIEDYRRLKNP